MCRASCWSAAAGRPTATATTPLLPLRIDLLKQIAELLATNGIASLRYDKRGVAASAAQAPVRFEEQERFYAWDNYVGDVMAAHAELLRHDEIKPYATALLGHSEGGLLALAAAAAMGKRAPYALVLAGTPGRPLIDIVRRQISRTGPQYSAVAERIMKAILDTGHVPADTPAELQLIFPPYAGPFFRGILTFDPAQAVASLDTACLLLHGGADAQVVPMDDIQPLIDALARRGKPGEAIVFPAVSHNLKPVASAGRSRLRRAAGARRGRQARELAAVRAGRLIAPCAAADHSGQERRKRWL